MEAYEDQNTTHVPIYIMFNYYMETEALWACFRSYNDDDDDDDDDSLTAAHYAHRELWLARTL